MLKINLSTLKMWAKERRNRPKEKLRVIVEDLRLLQIKLHGVHCEATSGSNPLMALVQFFGCVSPWQDQGGLSEIIAGFKEVDHGQYSEVIDRLTTLDRHFVEAGRNPYGMNRTEKGQPVTAENVFLGNIYGLYIHPVSFWISKKDDPKGRWGWAYEGLEKFNAFDVVSRQAKEFLGLHVDPISKEIDWLNEFLWKN